MAFGSYERISWVDGASPPISADNLNSHEDLLVLTDEELRRSQCVNLAKSRLKEYFWNRNDKQIDSFDDEADWATTGTTTLSNDTDNAKIGINSIQVEESDIAAGWIGINKDIAALDLSVFNDGSVSTTSDLIYLLFYMSDVTKFGWFQFKLGTDNANNYTYVVAAAGFSNGYNYLMAAKSAFTPVGVPPGWNNITHLRVEATTIANAQGEYFICDYWQMIRENPVYSGVPCSFQEYMGTVTGWVNVFEIWTNIIDTVYDNLLKITGIMFMPPDDEERILHIYCTVQSFVSYIEQYVKYEDYSIGLCWYVDSNNYIRTFIDAGDFYIEYTEGGITNNINVSLDETLLKNERIIIKFEKNNDTIRSILYKAGEKIHVLEYETSIDTDAEGCIYIASYDYRGWGLITDFAVAANYGNLDLYNDWFKGPKAYLMRESIEYTSNTLLAVGDFFINLPANKLFEVKAIFTFYNGDAAPDIKISWNYSSDIHGLTGRACIGGVAVTNSSEPSTTNKVRTSVHGIGTSVRYAADQYTCIAKETFVIRTGIEGGYIQPQIAEYNTDAVNPTILSTSSFIIVTEVFK
jgi:hypothetical protein